MDWIVHICKKEEWMKAQVFGKYEAESLHVEGFIHCSRPDQVLKVANAYYPEQDDLVLLWIDPKKLTADLKWEASDGDVFPHLYGLLNLTAAVYTLAFPPDSKGIFNILPKPE